MHTVIKQEAINNYYITKLSGDSDSECYAVSYTHLDVYKRQAYICDAAKEALDKGMTRYTPAAGTVALRLSLIHIWS